MSRFTLKGLAEKILNEERIPLTVEDIWAGRQNQHQNRRQFPHSSSLLFL